MQAQLSEVPDDRPSGLAPELSARVDFWEAVDGLQIIFLQWGRSFDGHCHEGIQAFDTVEEAVREVARSVVCRCEKCCYELKKKGWWINESDQQECKACDGLFG
jgi:hypothetical protein